MKTFMPLREEAEKRGKLIKAASDRHAAPEEACKLIGNFSQAETKMIKYIEANASKCGIPPQVGAQMKDGHKNTEAMPTKVCNGAADAEPGPAGPSLSEVLGLRPRHRRPMPAKGRQHLRHPERQRPYPMICLR